MGTLAFTMGLAFGLLTVGIAGIISALSGREPSITDLYLYLPLFVSGTALGWLTGSAIQAYLYVKGERIKQRLEEARTWALELDNEKKELAIRATLQPETASPAPVIVPADSDFRLRWQQTCHRFLAHGETYGFGIRTMVSRGLVTWDDWSTIIGVLTEAGITVRSPRAGWAEGWSLERWRQEKHLVKLPLPPNTEPPPVSLTPTTTTGSTLTTATTAVIDG